MAKTTYWELDVGKWVEVRDLMYYNPVLNGFITDLPDDRYFCIYVPSVGAVLRLPFVRYLVTPLTNDLPEEDIYTLIELAIETKDKEWFHQLVSKLKPSGQGISESPEDLTR